MHLAILDDDEKVALFLATVACNCGWTAQAIAAVPEFQALIHAAPPDAILLDLQLGTSDGIEQLHFLRRAGYTGAIVLISGFDTRVLSAAREIGNSLGLAIAAVLEKPVPAARLAGVLAAIRSPTTGTPRPAQTDPRREPISATDVARALDQEQMELHLQPIVSAAGQGVTHAEALIRWHDPLYGLVSPEQFIPVVEQDVGITDRLTLWVAEAGVELFRRLAERGPAIQICVNISGTSLRSPDFPDRIAATLDRLSAPRGAIGLEITESIAAEDLNRTAAILTRLRLKGFPVALDDFGTGHSSLTVLRRMPFSAVKIDKSFVADVVSSSDSLKIVRSVIQLARDLSLASIAEGVASADAADLLTALGIDRLQGHYFSEPLPIAGFATWLHAWSREHPPPRLIPHSRA
jgi:EAL domain-containing protein (putative c-di-GMP-specific phosphodiesterase class I)/FixJ family two-component response regulator